MAAAGKPQVLKQYNTSMIQRLIMEKGPITKPELSHLTNLSLPTVNKIVDELVTEKIVMEDMIQTGAGAGRKAMAYVVNGNYGTFVTLYYLDEKWIGCVSNILGEVLFKAEYYINSDHKKEELEFLTAAVDDLLMNAERVKAIGIGIPGIVMNDEKIAAIPQLPEFEGINLKKLFQEKYQLPVFIENDVKLMTVGYYSCRMKNLNNMVFLYIGNGIGGGTIINGQLYKGNTCFAGEFGYIPSGQEETEEEFRIGCMCTLRQLELHEGLNQYFNGVFKECTRHIVGVQFRNGATAGGSVFGRYGFSDILTCLMALDTSVELYQGGIVPIAEFAKMPYDRDVLVSIRIRKDGRKAAYTTQRRTKTDFPLIACCAARKGSEWYFSVGARPARAELVAVSSAAPDPEEIAERFSYGDNVRGSGEYRRELAKIYLARLIKGLKEA